jgi:cytochrome c-type biogenesis protein CcmH/NrfG
MSNEQILAMVTKLEARLTSAPAVIEDLKAWKMLARSQMTLNQPEKAAVAYRAVLALEKPTTEAEMDLVQALLAQSNGKPSNEAKKLLSSAFARDPGDQKVLWLNAAAAQEIDDKAGAVRFLRLLLATLPPNQDEANQVQKFIDELSK